MQLCIEDQQQEGEEGADEDEDGKGGDAVVGLGDYGYFRPGECSYMVEWLAR